MDGLDVTRSLRRNGAVPIIMLTARADESDKLVGLELGADDYLTKPFSPKELVARVRSVLRRSAAAREPADLIRAGDVELNVPSMQLTIAGRRVELTPTEFQLLASMARQPGRVFSRAQLLSAVRGVARMPTIAAKSAAKVLPQAPMGHPDLCLVSGDRYLVGTRSASTTTGWPRKRRRRRSGRHWW